MEKICLECGFLLPIDDFYYHSVMADEHLNVCKTCTKARVRKHRRENESVREYDRKRAKTPERKKHARDVTIRWRAENPEKYKAETAVGNALRDGKLFKKPCEHRDPQSGEVCGVLKVHAHHEDYSKPLEVDWFCAKHHHRHHAAQKAA